MNKNKLKASINLKVVIVIVVVLIASVFAYLLHDEDSKIVETYLVYKNMKQMKEMISAKTAEDIVKICKKENTVPFSSCISAFTYFACGIKSNMPKEECIKACKKITVNEENENKDIILGERYNCFLQLNKYKEDKEVIKYRDMAKVNLPCNNINIENVMKNKDGTLSLAISSKYDFKMYDSRIDTQNKQKSFYETENIDGERYPFKSNEETIIRTSEKYTPDENDINITIACGQKGVKEKQHKEARHYSLDKKFSCNLQTQKCTILNDE